MKLSELIGRLIEIYEELNPGHDLDDLLQGDLFVDPEVRVASQPTYPLHNNICCVTLIENEPEYDENGFLHPDFVLTPLVYIAEGASCEVSPYAPRALGVADGSAERQRGHAIVAPD